jgi:hydrogenase-4 component E
MLDLLLSFALLLTLKAVASSRLGACIRVVAAQGVVLGLLPLAIHYPAWTWRGLVLAAGAVALKGWVFPKLLFRALREADVSREVEPYVGYLPSLILNLAAFLGGFHLAGRLTLPAPPQSDLLLPVAFFGIFAGLFLIIARKRAVNQVLGFIVLENGIFTFGVTVMEETLLLVELGVLLDVLVAVFVMGIMVFHINREFDHLETDRLSNLKD